MTAKNSSFSKGYHIKWMLVFYDLCIFALSCFLLLVVYGERLTSPGLISHALLAFICVFASRVIMDIYRLIWRYGGIQAYIKLLISDAFGGIVYIIIEQLFLPEHISGVRSLALFCLNLLGSLAIRMVYRYAYKCGSTETARGRFLYFLLRLFAGNGVKPASVENSETHKIKIAIIGAGRVGTGLASELLTNTQSTYLPRCFIDNSPDKVGKQIFGIPVISETKLSRSILAAYEIQELVFAVPELSSDEKRRLYEHYKQFGCKIEVYDYPSMHTAGTGRRHLREFDIEELLFRTPLNVSDEKTSAYYKDRVVLVTGGGGSIGSELCRQIAKMEPKKLIILDIAENGAYDVQQDLKMAYGSSLDICVEIVSVCNRAGLEHVFSEYRPQIVLHAAAHKHVPLMEHNCVEAVENNVFGTLNVVELCEKYGTDRFIMISTDKAVNPTNVMGATKRFCEMITQACSRDGSHTVFSATRFGNVLGSAGSVIPLFRKQIAGGGPVTLTDRRIIRDFMTIPEASMLVIQSGAMAKNGELFVLDMGKPVKILDLAENMIRLVGMVPYKDINIIETGLRPGEKLYEELLVKTEELDKTENSLIFIERDVPISREELYGKIEILRRAVETGDDDAVRAALKSVIPTYKSPEEVNSAAEASAEMMQARTL